MKKVILFFVIMFALSFSAMSQDLATDIVGKWKFVDVKALDAKGNPTKITPKLKKEMTEGKEIFMNDGGMVLEFKDGKMNTIPSDGKPEKYTVGVKSVTTKLGGKVYANVVNGKLEMTMTPPKNNMIALVFEKQ